MVSPMPSSLGLKGWLGHVVLFGVVTLAVLNGQLISVDVRPARGRFALAIAGSTIGRGDG